MATHNGAIVSLAALEAEFDRLGIPYETIIGRVPAKLFRNRPLVTHPWSRETAFGIFQVEEHATRGGTRDAFVEYSATKNWMISPNNPGSSCTIIVGPVRVCIVIRPDLMPTWSAGYGGAGRWTWSADGFAISKENCQARWADAFHPGVIELGIQVNVAIARLTGLPVVRHIIRDQAVWPPPRGWCGHEDYENGVKLGKSDPGPQYPWDYCMAETNKRLGQGGDDMPTLDEIEKMVTNVVKRETDSKRLTVKLPGLNNIFVYDQTNGRLVHDVNLTVMRGEGSTNALQLVEGNPDHDEIMNLPVLWPVGGMDMLKLVRAGWKKR